MPILVDACLLRYGFENHADSGLPGASPQVMAASARILRHMAPRVIARMLPIQRQFVDLLRRHAPFSILWTQSLFPMRGFWDKEEKPLQPPTPSFGVAHGHRNRGRRGGSNKQPPPGAAATTIFDTTFPNLQELRLIEPTRIHFSALGNLRFLRKLSLAGTHISAACLEKLVCLPSLDTLDLSNCDEGVTDEGIAHVARIPCLSDLDLSGEPAITDAGFALLCQTRQRQDRFRTLTFYNMMAPMIGLGADVSVGCFTENVPLLADLTKLTLADFYFPDEAQCDKMLRCIFESCRRLTEINIASLRCYTEAALEPLRGTSHVRLLCIDGNLTLRDGAFQIIATLVGLEELSMGCCSKFQDTGLRKLCSGPSTRSLRKLKIDKCELFTAPAFEALASLTSLEELQIAQTKVRTVEFLSMMPALTHLDVSSCFHLNEKSLIRNIGGLTQLQDLEAPSSEFKKNTLVSMGAVPHHFEHLSSLDIRGHICDVVMEKSVIGALRSFPSLRSVYVGMPSQALLGRFTEEVCRGLKSVDAFDAM